MRWAKAENQSRSWLETIQFVLVGSAKRTCWASLMRFHFLRAGSEASHREHELKAILRIGLKTAAIF